MNRFKTTDFDRLRAQALNATLLNEQPCGSAGTSPARDGTIVDRLMRTLQTIASLWNRRQRPLPEHIARSRDRMVDAVQL